ncbi:MAG: hypothetical protein RLO17_09815 [Cyclobacteriaceae bacterium]
MKNPTQPLLGLFIFLFACMPPSGQIEPKGIHPGKDHKQFWTYHGQEMLLLGASDDDNLFQMNGVAEHLELLKQNGGNYVRNTMSSRDSGNVWPFELMEDGLYDLNVFNEVYWQRFETFLDETSKRDIIVQIEVWATFDFYRENWSANPFNPKNNRNLNARRDKLDTLVSTHPVFTENNFFRSVPTQMSLHRPLYYQQKFVNKLLSYSLNYDHVLYCMDNETSVNADWGRFWAAYIKKAAQLRDKTVYCTEMWDPHELDHAFHFETFDHPEIYDFVDISQNNHNTGQKHWDNALAQIDRLKSLGHLRPVNNVKIYGSATRRFTSDEEGIENFIQNVFAGCASVRFHRPPSGIGLNAQAQAVVKSVREATDKIDWFGAKPSNELLEDREENEAYCRSNGTEYALYFNNGGEISLNTGTSTSLSIEWVDVMNNRWTEPKSLPITNHKATVTSPGKGDWIAIIK